MLALRHKSATVQKINGLKLNNERLEYLGDAILSAIVADYLFKRFPYKSEGFLTEMRSKIVSRSTLNKLSNKLGLEKMVLSDTEQNYKSRSAGGDAFEAFVGAMYLDRGYYFTRRIIVNRIIGLHFDLEALISEEISYKSRIIEWAQKEKKIIEFKVLEEVGEKQEKQFRVAVMLEGEQVDEGMDYSIKGAEKIAAEKAWNTLVDV
jgi:ribonuclease-3